MAAVFIIWRRLEAPPQAAPNLPHRKGTLVPPDDFPGIGSPVISPSGRTIAYVTGSPQGHGYIGGRPRRLWIWQLDQNEPRELATLSASVSRFASFFWSPGNDFIAFASGGQLKKVAIQGGNVTTLGQIPESVFLGGTWAPHGNSIVFAIAPPNRLYELATRGGDPRLLAEHRDPWKGLVAPYFLPIQTRPGALLCSTNFRILLHDLDTGLSQEFVDGQGSVYSPSGHIVFEKAMEKDEIWALPFSIKRLERVGERRFPLRKTPELPVLRMTGRWSTCNQLSQTESS